MDGVIGERLREVFHFFLNNLGVLLLVTVPFGMVAAVFVHWQGAPVALVGEEARVNWQSAVPLLLLEPLALGLKVLAIDAIATGSSLSAARLLAGALRAWPVLAPLWLLTMMGVSVLAMVLFLLPGAWLYARLGQAPMIALLESRTPLDAIVVSWQRSREGQFEAFLLALVIGGGVVLAMLALFSLFTSLGQADTFGADLTARCLGETGFALVTVAFYRLWDIGRQAR